VVAQTRRHAAVLALLDVPRLVLAVNKIDLVGHDRSGFTAIAEEFSAHARALGYAPEHVVSVPISALNGDNVVERSARMPWYEGPTVLEHLETVPVAASPHDAPFRFPVQHVIRPRTVGYADYRGYAGQVAAGSVRDGDEVTVWPHDVRTRITCVDTPDGPQTQAHVGQSVTLLLADDLDITRGDLISAGAPPTPVEELDATLCWLAEKPLTAGARVLVKHGTRTVPALVTELIARLDEQALSRSQAPQSLRLNEIGWVRLRTAQPLPVDDYRASRATGSFLVIDAGHGQTLAAGLVGSPLPTLTGEAGCTAGDQ
jgi:sulfate adenylyltransferase subunit 1